VKQTQATTHLIQRLLKDCTNTILLESIQEAIRLKARGIYLAMNCGTSAQAENAIKTEKAWEKVHQNASKSELPLEFNSLITEICSADITLEDIKILSVDKYPVIFSDSYGCLVHVLQEKEKGENPFAGLGPLSQKFLEIYKEAREIGTDFLYITSDSKPVRKEPDPSWQEED